RAELRSRDGDTGAYWGGVCWIQFIRSRVGGQEWNQVLSHTDWSDAWAAATVRNGESLVQVEVGDIAAELTRLCPAGQRVHIGAIDVHLATGSVHLVADLANLRVKDTVGRWVGDHDAGHVLTVLGNLGVQVFQVDGSVFCRLDHNNAQVGQGGRSCVGAVCGSRNQNNIAVRIAIGYVVAVDSQEAS